ncbi:hypothetical protein ABPG75_007532 [Micractinium tetrahymenae]
MKGEQQLLRLGSEIEEEERASPLWSLKSFGFQQRRPLTAAGGGERKSAAQFAVHLTPADWPPAPSSPQHVATQPWWSPTRCAASSRLRCGLLAAALLALLAWGGVHLASGHGGASAVAGGGSGSSEARRQHQQQCRLAVRGSVWDQHCQRLERVCVDQGTLILYDDRYQQLGGRKAGKLPELLVDTSKIFEYPWRGSGSSSAGSDSTDSEEEEDGGSGSSRRRLRYQVQQPTRTRRIPPLPMRPATAQEPTAYLQDPQFSSCTVPIFLYASWRGNFFHVFKDLSAVMYAMLRRTPWRAHAKLVSVTPEGLPLTQPEAALLPLLSPLSVQTMADFSSRLAGDYRPELDASQPPASYEGGERRCFQAAFFCGRNFPLDRGLPVEEEAALSPKQQAAALEQRVPLEPYSFGQAVALFKQQQAQRQQQQQGGSSAAASFDAISLQAAAAEAAGAPQLAAVTPAAERARTTGMLRIVFMKRGSEGRQILNVAELLRRCNTWRYEPPGGGPAVTAECREVSLPDLEAGVAAAQQADVFIGMHGANLANGWMLRPGASVIELIPYQFDTGRGAMVFSTMNAKDATSQVLWWVGILCDSSASTPGPEERAGTGLSDWWPRDRSSRVPWAALKLALADVVAAGGSQQRYLEKYYAANRHRFYFGAGGVLGHGTRCPNATAGGSGR